VSSCVYRVRRGLGSSPGQILRGHGPHQQWRGKGWAWDRDGKQRIFVVFLQPGLVADGSEYCGGLLNSILIQSFFECQYPFKLCVL
jgi:hypothetical protein